MTHVTALFNPATGDTVANGREFRHVYPSTTPPYAAVAIWYIGNQPVEAFGRRYDKAGLPVVVSPDTVRLAGHHEGVPLFAGEGQRDRPGRILVPIRPGCEVQPYDAR